MTGVVETIRSVVRAEQCDHFGHMNIQFYSGALSDGFMCLMSLIGLGHAVVRERQLGLVATGKDLRFRRELRAGDHFKVETGFVLATPEQMHIGHRLTRLTDDKLALTADTMCVPLDLAVRRRTAMPDDIVAAAQAFVADPSVFDL